MLIRCKLGPTTQTVSGVQYAFNMDKAGRAVCEIGDDHSHLFLARADIYERAGGLTSPPPPIVDEFPIEDDEDDEHDELFEEADEVSVGLAPAPDLGIVASLAAEAVEMPDVEVPPELAAAAAASPQPADAAQPPTHPYPEPVDASAQPADAAQPPTHPYPEPVDASAQPATVTEIERFTIAAAAQTETPAPVEPHDSGAKPFGGLGNHDGVGGTGGAVPLMGEGWAGMTVPQLEAFAEARGVRLGRAVRRDAIITLLNAAGEVPPKTAG